jgi:hypothetical protein
MKRKIISNPDELTILQLNLIKHLENGSKDSLSIVSDYFEQHGCDLNDIKALRLEINEDVLNVAEIKRLVNELMIQIKTKIPKKTPE